jgi:hypothetical protein
MTDKTKTAVVMQAPNAILALPGQQWPMLTPEEVAEPKAAKGRYRFFTADKVAKLGELLRKGLSKKGCCQALGCDERTFYEEMERNPRFQQFVTRTETECEEALLGTIVAATQKDWRAAGWIAERRFPDRWGQAHKVQHAHVHGLDSSFTKLLTASRNQNIVEVECIPYSEQAAIPATCEAECVEQGQIASSEPDPAVDLGGGI